MLLILTSTDDLTATYLCDRLDASSFPFVRVDTDNCFEQLRANYRTGIGPTLYARDRRLTPIDISTVWLRRPRSIVVPVKCETAEAVHIANEWGEAIEGFLAHIPQERWMNYPARNACASHKLEQLTRATHYGLRIPDSLVTQLPEELEAFWLAHNERIVAKPLASGYIERSDGADASIFTNRVLAEHANSPSLLNCPTLFQEEIEKTFDVRVTIIDERITAVGMQRLVSGTQIVDIRRDNMSGVRYTQCFMPSDVEAALRSLIASYGLRFAAVDFAITKAGEWIFFEINPNGQWAWLDIAGSTHLWEDFIHAFSS